MSNITTKTDLSTADILLMKLQQHVLDEQQQYEKDLKESAPKLDEQDKQILNQEHENAMRTLRMAIDAVTNAKAMFFGL